MCLCHPYDLQRVLDHPVCSTVRAIRLYIYIYIYIYTYCIARPDSPYYIARPDSQFLCTRVYFSVAWSSVTFWDSDPATQIRIHCTCTVVADRWTETGAEMVEWTMEYTKNSLSIPITSCYRIHCRGIRSIGVHSKICLKFCRLSYSNQ